MVHAGRAFWFPVAMGAIIWIGYGLRSPSPARALSLTTPNPLEIPEETTMRFA